MSSILRRHMSLDSPEKGAKVVVAVKGSKEIPRTSILWALSHVVQPGEGILLLVVLPPPRSGKKLWGFPKFSGDCASSHAKPHVGTTAEQISIITDSCSQMMRQLNDDYDPNKIKMKIKLVYGSPCGAVAAESKSAQANWVILDKQLNHEKKKCLEELQCNIVVMKRSQPKVLRLNLGGSLEAEPQIPCHLSSDLEKPCDKLSKHSSGSPNSIRGPTVTPTSSPEFGTPFTSTKAGASSVSSSDPGTSPFCVPMMMICLNKEEQETVGNQNLDEASCESDCENTSPSATIDSEILGAGYQSSKQGEKISYRLNEAQISIRPTLLARSRFDQEVGISNLNYGSDLDFCGSIREAVSLSRNAPCGPPLCSVCQHRAPVFGKPPRSFTFAELEIATDGFSHTNFLAEGGFGSFHRGVLPDGQKVAVKQLKLAAPEGDRQFCSEVEVLSCAQHRNVVMLIGFCVQDTRRLLIYEYICNGSLSLHLYGHNKETLEWSARKRIAVGAARGLRYLHEECRVGCIVHRDMRTQNILITHDFEPLVGDFGLARWQPDGDSDVETQVVSAFGYVAPECNQTSQITEKADVYSFGVVLLELVTGQKAYDITRPMGQHYLTEWARPLLKECVIHKLIEPCLGNRFLEHEVYCMLYAASFCISLNPHARPRMSQVLRILEGDVDTNHLVKAGFGSGSRSGQMHQAFGRSYRKHSYDAVE